MEQKEVYGKQTIMDAYKVLVENCRNHHHTCQGCPLHIVDPTPYPSGIPRYTCAAFPGDNIPPAAWVELDPEKHRRRAGRSSRAGAATDRHSNG